MTALFVICLGRVWWGFQSLMGFIEAYYWHFREVTLDRFRFVNKNEQKDLHPELFLVRVIVASLLGLVYWYCIGKLSVFYFITAIVLQSEYFHLGVMYSVRNSLNSKVYPKRFKDVGNPKKTTSWFDKIWEIDYPTRAVMFYLGILFEILSIWFA